MIPLFCSFHCWQCRPNVDFFCVMVILFSASGPNTAALPAVALVGPPRTVTVTVIRKWQVETASDSVTQATWRVTGGRFLVCESYHAHLTRCACWWGVFENARLAPIVFIFESLDGRQWTVLQTLTCRNSFWSKLTFLLCVAGQPIVTICKWFYHSNNASVWYWYCCFNFPWSLFIVHCHCKCTMLLQYCSWSGSHMESWPDSKCFEMVEVGWWCKDLIPEGFRSGIQDKNDQNIRSSVVFAWP